MQTYIKPIKQNNDHTRIARHIRFRSSFKTRIYLRICSCEEEWFEVSHGVLSNVDCLKHQHYHNFISIGDFKNIYLLVFAIVIERFLRNLSPLHLTLWWRRPLSYRNQSIDLLRKSMDWFLYDNVLRHES